MASPRRRSGGNGPDRRIRLSRLVSSERSPAAAPARRRLKGPRSSRSTGCRSTGDRGRACAIARARSHGIGARTSRIFPPGASRSRHPGSPVPRPSSRRWRSRATGPPATVSACRSENRSRCAGPDRVALDGPDHEQLNDDHRTDQDEHEDRNRCRSQRRHHRFARVAAGSTRRHDRRSAARFIITVSMRPPRRSYAKSLPGA